MSEIWIGALITVGGGIISGQGAEKKDKADKAYQSTATKKETAFSGILSQFERESDDYYSQLNRARKQRGLDEFRKFSTLNQFAPQYINENRIDPGQAPSISDLVKQIDAVDKALADPPKKKKRGLLEKLSDPLGLAKVTGINPSISAMLESGGDSVTGKTYDYERQNAEALARYEAEKARAQDALGG